MSGQRLLWRGWWPCFLTEKPEFGAFDSEVPGLQLPVDMCHFLMDTEPLSLLFSECIRDGSGSHMN